MVTFDIVTYNNLPLIANANARFEKQLASTGLTREQLFSELAPLFLDSSYAGRYAPCLLHRHYSLNDGERMVTTNLSTRPSSDISPGIVAESWSSSGEEVEYRFTEDPASLPPRPPTDFLAKYKSILNSRGIDVLGVCYAPDKLADGLMFSEVEGLTDRERVTTIIHPAARSDNSYDATWLVTRNPDGQFDVIVAGCCDGDFCRKKPPPTPPASRPCSEGHKLNRGPLVASIEIMV